MEKDLAHVWIWWVDGKDDFLLGGLPATCLGSFQEGSASPFWGAQGGRCVWGATESPFPSGVEGVGAPERTRSSHPLSASSCGQRGGADKS